jgi:hypothetical protein
MENPVDKDKIADLPGLMAYPHHVGGVIIRPEDQGKIKGKAMAAMRDQTQRQLSQLYTQMQTLVDQAGDLKKRVEISENIYKAGMPFEPVIGHEYFMYERDNGTHFISMISPREWGNQKYKNQFKAAITLLSDHTWEVKAETN